MPVLNLNYKVSTYFPKTSSSWVSEFFTEVYIFYLLSQFWLKKLGKYDLLISLIILAFHKYFSFCYSAYSFHSSFIFIFPYGFFHLSFIFTELL